MAAPNFVFIYFSSLKQPSHAMRTPGGSAEVIPRAQKFDDIKIMLSQNFIIESSKMEKYWDQPKHLITRPTKYPRRAYAQNPLFRPPFAYFVY